MKRANKCVGKKRFNNKGLALAVCKKHWLKRGRKFAIYECPVCLDFHLTSKWCNTDYYITRWTKQEVRKQWIEFQKLEGTYQESKRKVKRKKKKKVKTTLKGMLSQSELNRVFQDFQPHVYNSPKQSWWSRIIQWYGRRVSHAGD